MNTSDHSNWKRKRFLFIPIFITGLFVLSAVVMLLWNAILPKVSGLLALSYWQAMGILVLSRILFGSVRFIGRHSHRHSYMHPSFRNRFMEMNDEEREQFKNQWRQRCCK